MMAASHEVSIISIPASLPSFTISNYEQNLLGVIPNDDNLDIDGLFNGNEGPEDIGVTQDNTVDIDDWVGLSNSVIP